METGICDSGHEYKDEAPHATGEKAEPKPPAIEYKRIEERLYHTQWTGTTRIFFATFTMNYL